MKHSPKQEKISRLAKALSHPSRIAILQLLCKYDCCYHGDIAEELQIPKSTLSQHLNELKDAGLIKGTIKPPTVSYCIDAKNWNSASTLLQQFFTPVKLLENCKN
ncbi:MAG: winged helix-turn-helix domain-containing protein [Bacteroidia bacterium]|jgi:predicted transcriptional regulator|nr:winged helix-turn-helix domain-containing protein [Bacteroidia bacterium]